MYEFTALDRCDRGISERAYYRVTKDDMELMFCIHHYKQHEYALASGGWSVECDEVSASALAKPLDVSANA